MKIVTGRTVVIPVEAHREAYFKIATEFIERLFQGMMQLSMKFFDHVGTGELPYEFHERQLDSIILPVLSRICDGAVLAEMPAERKYRSREGTEYSNGRLDYWCIYRNYTFVIEVKHAYDAFRTDHTRVSKVVEPWTVMTKRQLETIVPEVKAYTEQTKGVIRLGLEFVVSYSDARFDDDEFKTYKRRVPTILERLCNDVSGTRSRNPRPDHVGYWLAPLKLRQYMSEDENSLNYPGVLLLGKVYEPIIHEGCISR